MGQEAGLRALCGVLHRVPTLNTFKWVNYTKKLKISFLKIILKTAKLPSRKQTAEGMHESACMIPGAYTSDELAKRLTDRRTLDIRYCWTLNISTLTTTNTFASPKTAYSLAWPRPALQERKGSSNFCHSRLLHRNFIYRISQLLFCPCRFIWERLLFGDTESLIL